MLRLPRKADGYYVARYLFIGAEESRLVESFGIDELPLRSLFISIELGDDFPELPSRSTPSFFAVSAFREPVACRPLEL